MSATSPHRLLVGVGNAGVTILDLLAVESPGKKGLLVVNNDPESLSASVVTERIAVPEGDPGEGFRAIDGEFGRALSGASSVVLCGGLGGGIGIVSPPRPRYPRKIPWHHRGRMRRNAILFRRTG